MNVPLALSLLLASAAIAGGADKPAVVKLDSPPQAEWVTIPADPVLTTLSTGVAAKWLLVDDGPNAELRPAADGKSATFAATTDGHFRVLVIAGEDVHRLRVVKAGKPPDPMPPGPDKPEPKPPADPLVKLLQVGYDADPRGADLKRKDVLDLVELYRQAAVLAAVAEVTTTGQLVARVRDAAKSLGVSGLADCRKVIGAELAAVFPEDVPLSVESRKRAAEVFARVGACLGQVK